MIEVSDYDTPVGTLRAACLDGALIGLAWTSHWDAIAVRLERLHPDVAVGEGAALGPLAAYLHGECGAIDDLAVNPGGTDFQRAVWSELRTIPVGSTFTYRGLAERIGRPGSFRAVGAANGANPIWIVIPCHRLVGSDGDLTGYGGGLDRKRWLLEHEGVVL